MPTLSEHDPERTGRSGPPIWVIAAIVAAVAAVVVLHLTGIIGPS